LNTNDLGYLVAGLIALIATFLPWYSESVDFNFGEDLGIPGTSESQSAIGWETGAGVLAALLILIGLAYVAAKAFGVKLPKLPFPPSLIAVVVAALAMIIVLIRWLSFPSESNEFFDRGASFGVIVCFIALVAMTAFAVLSMLAEMKKGATFGSGRPTPAFGGGGGPGGGQGQPYGAPPAFGGPSGQYPGQQSGHPGQQSGPPSGPAYGAPGGQPPTSGYGQPVGQPGGQPGGPPGGAPGGYGAPGQGQGGQGQGGQGQGGQGQGGHDHGGHDHGGHDHGGPSGPGNSPPAPSYGGYGSPPPPSSAPPSSSPSPSGEPGSTAPGGTPSPYSPPSSSPYSPPSSSETGNDRPPPDLDKPR